MKFKNKKEEFIYCVDKGVFFKERGDLKKAGFYFNKAQKIKEEIEKEENKNN